MARVHVAPPQVHVRKPPSENVTGASHARHEEKIEWKILEILARSKKRSHVRERDLGWIESDRVRTPLDTSYRVHLGRQYRTQAK